MARWQSLGSLFLALSLALITPAAQASEDLTLTDWLGRPGVKLVVVEFYATWCKPCMEAMPRWAALKEKYRKQGLRVIVVNTLDPQGGCRGIGWSPDETVCDLEGRVADSFRLNGQLPAAFLWSWQGNLLVQKGHVAEVEREVERYLLEAPRVAVEAGAGVGPAEIAALRERLAVDGKLTVVAGDAERTLLAKALRKQQAPGYDENLQCALGREVPPNAVLKVSRVAQGKAAYLNLALLDLESGCQTQVVSVPWESDIRAMAGEAVGKLLGRLKRAGGLQMPGGGGRMAEPVPPERKGPRVERGVVDEGGADKGPAVGGGEIAAAVGRLIVTVAPKDAYVEVTGPKGFKATSRGGWEHAKLGPGRYSVTASAAGYEGKTAAATVEVDEVATVKVGLERLGGLEVVGSPAGAKVEISGPEGFKESGGLPVVVRDAVKGEYTVAVSKAGYEGERYGATVKNGDTARVQVGLKQPGSLVVEGTPAGAQVDITGPGGFSVTKGLPVTVEGASRGTYRVKVTRQGYGAFEATAEVKGGETSTVGVKLVKESAGPVAGSGGASKAVGGWVRIEPGAFTMGSPGSEEGRDLSEEQHKVTITRGFWLKPTEVTQGEWTAVMGSNPSNYTACGSTCPVEQVSWNDAVAYCNKLSERENLQQCYVGERFVGLGCTGYRLPTEAEWEYAARAGTTGARHGEVGAVAWYDGNSNSTTHPVGQKQANAWGLHDMLGNVWEWTSDWYDGYSGAARDPVGPDSGQYRVIRGGGWALVAADVRSAYRNGGEPGNRADNIGFRPARSVP